MLLIVQALVMFSNQAERATAEVCALNLIPGRSKFPQKIKKSIRTQEVIDNKRYWPGNNPRKPAQIDKSSTETGHFRAFKAT
jgi:hypothetical protein